MCQPRKPSKADEVPGLGAHMLVGEADARQPYGEESETMAKTGDGWDRLIGGALPLAQGGQRVP